MFKMATSFQHTVPHIYVCLMRNMWSWRSDQPGLRTIICDIEYEAVFIAKRRHMLRYFHAVPFVSRQFNDKI